MVKLYNNSFQKIDEQGVTIAPYSLVDVEDDVVEDLLAQYPVLEKAFGSQAEAQQAAKDTI